MSREVLVVFYGNEISLGLFYGFWLFWIAIGSWTTGQLAKKIPAPRSVFLVVLGLTPLAAASEIILIRFCRQLIEVTPSQIVPLGELALWSAIVTLPVGLLIGAIFPLLCQTINKEEDISRVYIWDAIGGLAGGLLFTFWFVESFSLWQIMGLMTLSLGAAFLPLAFLFSERDKKVASLFSGMWAGDGLLILISPFGVKQSWPSGFRSL